MEVRLRRRSEGCRPSRAVKSNFRAGVGGVFILGVWAGDANPVTAAITLVDRVSQVEVRSAAGAPQNGEAAPAEEPPPARP